MRKTKKSAETHPTPDVGEQGITPEIPYGDIYLTHEDFCSNAPELLEKTVKILETQKDDPEFAEYQRSRLPALRKSDPELAKKIEEIFGKE